MSFFAAHKLLSISLVLVAVLGVAVVLFSRAKKVAPVGWGLYGVVNSDDGVAIGGFDPLSYRSGKALPGSPEHSFEHAGVRWQFASAENRDAFAKDADALAPAYGGFCAFAVAKGFTASVQPGVFAVHEDQVYLFADEKIRADWLAGPPAQFLENSEANWKKR